MGRRAKIVCTLGPATASQEQVAGLVAAGADVVRLNMSHGTHDGHLAAYRQVRAAADAAGRSVGVLADLQGPKIRLGEFPGGPVRLVAGQEFTITAEQVPGDAREAATTYAGLADDVRPGDQVLVDDGRVLLEVLGAGAERVRTRVLVGGLVSDHKGLNLPGVRVSAPALTPKDTADLRWALDLRADLSALSFVRSADDAAPARRVMDEVGVWLPLIAKIEKPQALAALGEIIEAAERECVAADLTPSYVPTTTGGAIARAAAEIGAIVGAKALVAFTLTGETARRLARYRSPIPLLAFTTEQSTRSQLTLTWGVETFLVPQVRHTDDMVRQVEGALLDVGRCEKGDRVVIVAGSPPGTPGKTNALRVHCIGDAAR